MTRTIPSAGWDDFIPRSEIIVLILVLVPRSLPGRWRERERGRRTRTILGANHDIPSPVSKVFPDAKAALAGLLRDDLTIAAGGFGLCGIPENLIVALRDSG